MAVWNSFIFKLRRSTASEWTNVNPVLREGEPGLELDTNKLKFGNGTAPWNELSYFGAEMSYSVADSEVIITRRGINLSGAEFTPDAAHLPGTWQQDYMYPSNQDLAYIASRGHKVIRLAFRWERVQPELLQSLDVAEALRIIAVVNYAYSLGIKTLLDVHNSGRFIKSEANGGAELVLGDGILTNAHLTDLWVRLSKVFKNNPGVLGYGLMNEPHDLPGIAGAFTTTFTHATWDSSTQGWTGEASATVSVSSTRAHDGINSLAVTKTFTAGGFQNARISDNNGSTHDETPNGVIYTTWVWCELGETGWSARIDLQDANFSNITGAATPLTPGAWTLVSCSFTTPQVSAMKAKAVQIQNNNPTAGSKTFYVDTVRQGTLAGAKTPAKQWEEASQECVNAIRANLDTKTIYVPGYQYSGAQNWATNHPVAWIRDPLDRCVYEAHFYFDIDNSGTYVTGYVATNADAIARGYSSLTDRASTELRRFTSWLSANRVKGFIGEMGWHNAADTESWNAVGEALYDILDAAYVGVTYWAAGQWYGNTYNLSAYHGSPLTLIDSPATIIEAHPSITMPRDYM